MFDPEFYPTPSNLVLDMISPYLSRVNAYNTPMNILEPSAGSWAILDVLKNIINSNRNIHLFAIEQSLELQAMLRGKKYNLIDTDFLSYQKDMEFDLIVMNPPFSNWDEHFLKAWDIAENTDIVCLLNAETIKNTYSEKRKLVERIIKDNNWTVTYIQDAFKNADRKTSIEIAMVRVKKVTEKTRFSFDWMKTEKIEMNEDILQNELATRDMIQNIIDDYARSRDMFAEWMKLIQQSQNIASSISNNYELKAFQIAWNDWPMNDRYTDFITKFKQGIWNKIAKELNIEKYMTSGLREDFSKYMKDQWTLAISHENIRSFADMIFGNRWNIMEKAIHEVFDEFTKYHTENRVYIEGWKTNDKWKVSKKVILPRYVELKWSGWMQIEYSKIFKMNDIDKALCYISWIPYESITTIEKALEEDFKVWNKKTESTFFEIRYFLKWTVHLIWKDKKLMDEFNMRACAGKNWLPESEKDKWKKSKQQKSTWIIISNI